MTAELLTPGKKPFDTECPEDGNVELMDFAAGSTATVTDVGSDESFNTPVLFV